MTEVKKDKKSMVYDGSSENTGKLVSIRPIHSEKTFLGIYLGEIAVTLKTEYQEKDDVLLLSHSFYNPAIFVPGLGKVVFGYESWWGVIEGPEDLREITNQDIDNTILSYLMAVSGNGIEQ